MRRQRYDSFESGKGAAFEEGKLTLQDLHSIALEQGEIPLQSGKQEMLENLVNRYI